MPPVAQAKPPGMARAAKQREAEEAFQRHTEERTSLQSAQAANARSIKLERLARRDPVIGDLLDEYRALGAALKQANDNLAANDKARDELAAEASRLQEENIALKEKLAEALKPKRSS